LPGRQGNHAYIEAYGNNLPLNAHQGTIKAFECVQGNRWRTLMAQWTHQATIGTRVVPINQSLAHGAEFKFGDGSKIYTKDGRMLSDRQELLQHVASCNASLNSGLFPEEELGIAAWQNQRNYHFDQ